MGAPGAGYVGIEIEQVPEAPFAINWNLFNRRGDSNGRCHPVRFQVMQMHQLISAALVTDADAQLISAPEHPASRPSVGGWETPPPMSRD